MAQDVSLVFDTSGSMAGAKMEQARGALRYVAQPAAPGGPVQHRDLRQHGDALRPELQPAGAAERERALAFVDRLEASGGTNINDALVTAVGWSKAGAGGGHWVAQRPHTVIFVTDGLPTAGPREPEPIIAGVRAGAAAGPEPAVRVFPFGVGLRRQHRPAGRPGSRVRRGERLRQAGGEPGGGRLRLLRPGGRRRC